jgi:hypothetical protein
MRQPEQRSSVKSRGRCLLRGLAAIGHEVRALAIATRITLRDHIALVRQHADGSFWVRMSGGDRLVPPSYRSGDLRAARARADTGGSTSDSAESSALPRAHGYADQRIRMHGSRDRQLDLAPGLRHPAAESEDIGAARSPNRCGRSADWSVSAPQPDPPVLRVPGTSPNRAIELAGHGRPTGGRGGGCPAEQSTVLGTTRTWRAATPWLSHLAHTTTTTRHAGAFVQTEPLAYGCDLGECCCLARRVRESVTCLPQHGLRGRTVSTSDRNDPQRGEVPRLLLPCPFPLSRPAPLGQGPRGALPC